jgi:hypothetical protein
VSFVAADVAAYGAGLTVKDVTSYRRAGLADGIGERQTMHSITPLLRYCIGLRRFARWRGPALDCSGAIVQREFQGLAAGADAPDATEHIVVIDVSAPVAKRWAAEEGVSDADVPKTHSISQRPKPARTPSSMRPRILCS